MSDERTSSHYFLNGGGEMGKLIRSIDWSKTPLGDPDTWPGSLKVASSIMLSTPFPMYIAWGSEYTQLYNDGYRPILGTQKHPAAIGIGTKETFSEIWHIIGPMFEGVMNGKAVGFPNFMLPLERNGFIEECYFDFSYSPIYNEDGTAGGVLVTVIETTEQVKTLKSLKKSQLALEASQIELQKERDRLKRFFMQAPAGICILDGEEFVFELINPTYQQMFPGRALLGKPVLEAVPEIKDQHIYDILRDVYHSGITYEARGLLIPLAREADGPVEDRYFDFIYQARLNAQNKIDGILVFVYEVTDQLLTKQALEKTQASLNLALSAAGMGTWTVDLADGKLSMSEVSRMIHGIPKGETLSFDESFHLIFPEYREQVSKDIERAIRTKRDFQHEYWMTPKDGSASKWLRANGTIFYDAGGAPLHMTGTILDMTQAKETEQRKDDFISIASHELKTPITSLRASLQLLERMKNNPSPSMLPRLVEQSTKSMEKIINLVDLLLNSTRTAEGQLYLNKTTFIIADLINNCGNHVTMDGKHELVLEGDKQLQIYADEHRIDQVMVNLVNNAVKYAPNARKINVLVEKLNNSVKVSVKDDGPGIPPEKIPHLFNRYYRAESSGPQYSGLGLGLYISSEIIKRHGGEMGVDSELGKGSTFWFTLPLKNN